MITDGYTVEAREFALCNGIILVIFSAPIE